MFKNLFLLKSIDYIYSDDYNNNLEGNINLPNHNTRTR